MFFYMRLYFEVCFFIIIIIGFVLNYNVVSCEESNYHIIRLKDEIYEILSTIVNDNVEFKKT